jgi:rubrerythrin
MAEQRGEADEAAGAAMNQDEALLALARLEREAAAAYEVAARAAADVMLSAGLGKFRDDHLRHVRELNVLIVELGGEEVDETIAGGGLLLGELARLAEPLGDEAILLGLLSNEQLTNGSYEVALELEWDADTERILTRNMEDEQRHLRWLSEQLDQLASDLHGDQGAPADRV